MDWTAENIAIIVLAIIPVVSIIVGLTKTKKDDEIWAKVKTILKSIFGVDSGH